MIKSSISLNETNINDIFLQGRNYKDVANVSNKQAFRIARDTNAETYTYAYKYGIGVSV